MEYILEYENALESLECDKIIELFEDNKETHFEGFIGKNRIDNKKKNC